MIGAYDAAAEKLAVTLRAPVVLGAEAVEALQEGDTLEIEGEDPVEIYLLEKEENVVYINDGAIVLSRQENGTDRTFDYESICLYDVAALQLPVPETAVFLDDIDPESLDILEEPLILTAADFLAKLESETASDGVGFAADNVRVTFDENGDLAVIERFYVPWQ